MQKHRRHSRTRIWMRKNMKYVFPVVLYVLLYACCTLLGVVSSMPENVRYEVGDVSTEDIVANKDVVDQYSTNLQREEAQQKVLPIYYTDENLTLQLEQEMISAFSALEQVRQAAQVKYQAQQTEETQQVPADWQTLLAADMGSLKEQLPSYITEQNIYTVASMGAPKLEALREDLVENMHDKLVEGLLADDVSAAVEEIRKVFVEDTSFSIEEASLAGSLVQNILEANRFYDQEATEAAKKAAADGVPDVVYKKGQNIVREGEIISEAQFQLIRQMGLITESSHTLSRWISGAMITASLFIVGAMFATVTDRTLIEDKKTVMQVVSLTLLIVIIALICKRIDQRLCPVFIVSILGTVVLKRRTAVFYGVFASFLVAFVMAPQDASFFDERVLRQFAAGVLGSTASVLLMSKKQKRSEYILAGMIAGAVASLLYVSYGVLNGFTLREFVTTTCYAIASGLVSGFMAVGILPIWETLFSVVTPSKLLELTDPTRPLLRKLMVEAPGTYHHSIMVANLAEAGAEAIGADALLTRVAAYYHDVGKLADPLMFKENQINIPNPHDSMTPKESALIIRKHSVDGARMAAQNGLPQAAVDIISQHHGDSVVGYFYYMAKQQGEVDEKDFRYAGKKPQTKEAGVLMMADITEAAIRAKKAASDADLKDQIAALIKSKYDEGEFDECPITRKELRDIVDAFVSIFEGQRHERILYPQDKQKLEEQARQAEGQEEKQA